MQPTGSKLWRFAYRYFGKQKILALGQYPAVPLRDARRAHDDAKDFLAKGVDPSTARKAAKRDRTVAAGNTFAVIAEEGSKPTRVDGSKAIRSGCAAG